MILMSKENLVSFHIPNGVKNNRPPSIVIRLECLYVVLQSFRSHSAHVNEKCSAQLCKVCSFLGMVGHDGAGANGERDIGREVLDNLQEAIEIESCLVFCTYLS